jgi:CubicO group peptidase (beta-lactamase class C family)
LESLRVFRIAVVVSLALAAGQQSYAQDLTSSLLERYLESLRQQAGIPGMSAAVVQSGRIVWEKGFGLQNVERVIAARPDTPYPVADLSQTFAATVLLRECVDQGYLEVSDKVRRWNSQYPDRDITVSQLLAHASSGSYKYDPARYQDLGVVVEQCANGKYPLKLTSEVLNRLAMTSTVPGEDLGYLSNGRLYSADVLKHYTDVLARVATPYRVDSRGRPTVTDYSGQPLTTSTGIVSTVQDLAQFDRALTIRSDGGVVSPDTLNLAWNRAASGVPTGLGWFVQTYNNQRLVWHFGIEKDAYSSLILKVPDKDLTFIILANSDGLTAPYSLENGDVTKSLFATVFLKLFVP